MNRESEIRAQMERIEQRISELAEPENLTPEQGQEWDAATKMHARLRVELRAVGALYGTATRDVKVRDGTPYQGTEDRTLDNVQSAALRMLEAHTDELSARSADRVERLVRDDPGFAPWIEVHSRDEYLSAFGKVIMLGEARASVTMTDAERQAMSDSYHVRAQAEGATTSGGYAVPVWLDSSVLLTNQETGNPLLARCRVEDINTNVWKGVSAAGVVWSFDAEAAEVSDDSITLAQPSVTVNMARGFIPYSIEVGQDWPGFQAEMGRLLAEGYDDLVAQKMATGSGTNEPRGLLTALDANTNDEVVVTTDGAFGDVDIYKVWEALPMKYRRNAAWFMSTSIMDRIRAMGDATKWHSNTVQLPAGAIDVLFNRPVFEQPYFPDWAGGTTGAANHLVVGDPNAFVVARRAGMTVEVVPHLFGGSQRPTGQRGLFAWARLGANSANDLAWRLLQNQ